MEQIKILLTHPTGNHNVRAILSALSAAGMLLRFNTTLAVNPGSGWLRLLPGQVQQEFLRRTFPLPPEKINKFPYREMARMIFTKLHLKEFIEHESGFASVDAVYQDLDKKVARQLGSINHKESITAVYAFEDGALATFDKAKKLGLKCIYDLPIAYWEMGRSLMQEEAKRLPDWAITLGGGIMDSREKLERKTRELELADIIIGPGEFVINSLPAWSRDKLVIMSPYGSPGIEQVNKNCASRKSEIHKPLRVLFAGSMSQRKGLGDLFAAMQILNRPDVELFVMGNLMAPMEFYRKQFRDFIYEPPRPNPQVLDLMNSCDVFCLPSIVEGRALVMQEAMSQGLPLIITPNTGGADLIKEGKTGFLVPVRSPHEIAARLDWFAENRDLTYEMGIQAREFAAEYTWEKYGMKIVNSLKAVL